MASCPAISQSSAPKRVPVTIPRAPSTVPVDLVPFLQGWDPDAPPSAPFPVELGQTLGVCALSVPEPPVLSAPHVAAAVEWRFGEGLSLSARMGPFAPPGRRCPTFVCTRTPPARAQSSPGPSGGCSAL